MAEFSRALILGGTGFLGRHVTAALQSRGGLTVRSVGHTTVDLRDPTQSFLFLHDEAGPGTAVLHLAYPGSQYGIETSLKTPYTLAARLLQMDLNVIEACAQLQVPKLLCMGSACAYPADTILPTDESQLWSGYPELINAAYGVAKRTQSALLIAANQQYGLPSLHVILGNLYGPGDRTGHVIPSLIAKVRRALVHGGPVEVWGRPDVTRSFLYVRDAAEGLSRLLDTPFHPLSVNLTAPEETRMDTLIEAIADLLHYRGRIVFDRTKPTGHTRRQFDLTRLRALIGWEPPTGLLDGLEATIHWHCDHCPLTEVR